MRYIYVSLALFLASSAVPARADGESVSAAGQVILQVGKAFPQGNLMDFVQPAAAYRIKLFGGAHVPSMTWLRAVGLGIDFSYSSHDSKDGDPKFKYHRFLWDWLFIPISFAGLVEFTPGLAWVVTDMRWNRFEIDQTSIRPAGVLGLALKLPVLPYLSVRGDVRGEWAFPEQVRKNDGSRIDIVGSFWSGFLGLDVEF